MKEYVMKHAGATIYFDYAPPVPGKLSGPPEACYPDEPEEVTITAVMYEGVDILDFLEYYEGVTEELEGDACKYAEDRDDDY